ncbi:hypothetical protein ElyMa_005306700 [Elysia marginata]|uniref:Uncharacterized protein n=1 Tax=Elysia marginata TaxID=1093978 RepID=A0AAV4JYM4_9GAST|nr:hypothetical protein ElyMa_005306700 [Elysia marginata]
MLTRRQSGGIEDKRKTGRQERGLTRDPTGRMKVSATHHKGKESYHPVLQEGCSVKTAANLPARGKFLDQQTAEQTRFNIKFVGWSINASFGHSRCRVGFEGLRQLVAEKSRLPLWYPYRRDIDLSARNPMPGVQSRDALVPVLVIIFEVPPRCPSWM